MTEYQKNVLMRFIVDLKNNPADNELDIIEAFEACKIKMKQSIGYVDCEEARADIEVRKFGEG